MYRIRPYDKNREYTYHFLTRMKKFNCPVSANCEFDITDTLKRIEELRANGQSLGIMAYIAKATAKTIEAHPRLNERLFHGLFGRKITTYDDISCGMLAERQTPQGSYVLLPIIIKDAPNQSIEGIHALIKQYKSAPLDSLEPSQQRQKLEGLPRWVVPLIQFMFRIHPRYTAGKVSTYAISSVAARDGVMTGGHAPVFQTTFAPVNIIKIN